MDEREGVYDFGPEDVVIVGSPTYAGRIPNKLLPYGTRRNVYFLKHTEAYECI